MANKDTKFIDSKDVIRTQDGKIDLFQTILARKDPTAQVPVFVDHSQPIATSVVSVTSPSTTPDATKVDASTSSSSSSPSWRSTHVTSVKPSASVSAAATTSSPYATDAPTVNTTTTLTTGKATAPSKPAPKKMLWSAVFVEYCRNPLTIPDNIRYWHDDDHIVIKDAYAKAKVHMLVLPKKPVDKVTDLVGEAGIRTVEELVRVTATLLNTLKAENPYLDFKTGFHVIPSMRTIREKGSFEKTTDELNKYGSMRKVAMVCNQCSQGMKTIPMLNHHLSEHFTQKVKAMKRQ
ncbi:hypothetical protein BGZ47_001187 [Haplosporangium gracile]|nr:hypothetical protein BGZ47_001187 [Haplosporangium gracile]